MFVTKISKDIGLYLMATLIQNGNSILDDKRSLTLPNGECLNLPTNVRIMFELVNVKCAPSVTISRCGTVWFSSEVVTLEMIYYNYLEKLNTFLWMMTKKNKHMTKDGLVTRTLMQAEKFNHVMDFTYMRALNTLFSLLNKTVSNVIEYHVQNPNFPMITEHLERYVTKRLILCVIWSFSGDAKFDHCVELCKFVRGISKVDLPNVSTIVDYYVQINNGEWILWADKVPTIKIESFNLSENDVIVHTVDTIRYQDILYSWLSDHKPLLLCGPPGLNFSNVTTPESILKIFDQYCEYRKTPNGVILSPIAIGYMLVIICNEINLSVTDHYGTQSVISFLRQLIECDCYWSMSDRTWVKLERIQFVGNPCLCHVKVVPSLKEYAEPLTASIVEFYLMIKKQFTPDIQSHYIYSPRELTKWMRGIFVSIKPMKVLNIEDLIRIWAHEALRLFQDRFVTNEERKWVDEKIDYTAIKYFPNLKKSEALHRPILFSNWLSKHYISVEYEDLHDYLKSRLEIFNKELDVSLILFDDFIDHVLHIDHVFKQMQGHLLLIGISGSGKTILSRFVAWMNGLSVFQINAHNKYTSDDFDNDLRTVLKRAGCKEEKICSIKNESNMSCSSFLERMNTLLVNADVLGLFKNDEYNALITSCKEGSQRDGLMLESSEELYKWFTQQLMKNLHIIFTMSPPEDGLASHAAKYPVLFNCCVLDRFGDWSDQTFFQVGMEITQNSDLDLKSYLAPSNFSIIEKHKDFEEHQRHLNIGLNKLKEIITTINSLRNNMNIKSKELQDLQDLQEKDHEVNKMLKKLLDDQRERQVLFMDELGKIELNLEDAKKSVRGITKQQLIEIRAMNNPPEAVKMAMTSAIDMLGRKADNWQAVQSIIRSDDFISSIVNYDINKMTKNIRKKIKTKYLTLPAYNFVQVSRANKACGRLVKWVIDFVNCSPISFKDIDDLITAQHQTQHTIEILHQKVNRLENVIAAYKDQYADLINDKEAIKMQKWKTSSQALESQMETIVGDVLLSAALLAYGGYFDQQYREILIKKWMNHLFNSNIQVKQEFSVAKYLSLPDDRLSWQANSLLVDDLFIENAIMLNFLNNSFVKVLEDALLFGYLLIVQDAEHFDPILNSILNREVRRNGDRVLIKLGGQYIDFSPSFTLFLLTRNPYFNFSPDVCSKVTFVNFSATRNSLQSQCFNEILKVEQPNENLIRTDLIKTQCKLKLELRFFEKSLLQVLNESEGKILDDAKIQDTLRKLKQKATKITLRVEQIDDYMKEHIEQYTPLACALTLKRVSRALLREVYAIFAILLSQIKFHAYPDQIAETELENIFDVGTLNKIKEFMALPCFMRINKHFNENLDEWEQFMKFVAPKKQISERLVASLPQTSIIKYFRPDKVIPAVTELLSITFEPGFSVKTKISDFISLVLNEVQLTTPIFLCSVPGNDASYFLEHRVFELKIKCMSIAMDSYAGLILADKAIADSIKGGYWVLLKKVHLATPWLEHLEEKLRNMKAHRNFRLFFDMEINSK
ncbi:23040_t:CDS:10, partial [Dentiscutata erythropus]